MPSARNLSAFRVAATSESGFLLKANAQTQKRSKRVFKAERIEFKTGVQRRRLHSAQERAHGRH